MTQEVVPRLGTPCDHGQTSFFVSVHLTGIWNGNPHLLHFQPSLRVRYPRACGAFTASFLKSTAHTLSEGKVE